MKVKPNQNPAIPVQESEVANIKDGTSNTMQRSNAQNPFANDSFEKGDIKPGESAGMKYTMFSEGIKESALRGEAIGIKWEGPDFDAVKGRVQFDKKISE
jgi:hypothetical protein